MNLPGIFQGAWTSELHVFGHDCVLVGTSNVVGFPGLMRLCTDSASAHGLRGSNVETHSTAMPCVHKNIIAIRASVVPPSLRAAYHAQSGVELVVHQSGTILHWSTQCFCSDRAFTLGRVNDVVRR